MSLSDILSFRYPIVWVNTKESERLIVALSSIVKDREMYVFDSFDGLTIWDAENSDYKIITVEKVTMDGDTVDVPITDFNEAFQYVYDRESDAVLMIRNFHKNAENYYDVLASLYNKYYRGFRFDDLEQCPLSVICLSVTDEIPDEIRSMIVPESFDLPSESALTEVLSYLSENIPVEGAIEQEAVSSMAKACRGMTEFDVISTTFNLVKRDGKVTPEAIEKIKYDRLKASTTLEIKKPAHTLDEVGGLDYAKELIYKAMWIRNNPDEARRRGIRPINKFLYLGVPGTGKSYLCEGGAGSLELDLAKFGVSSSMSKWIGESERRMREGWAQIAVLSPIAVWIDELGRDFSPGDHDGGTTQRVHGELLTGLQELSDDVTLFAAANDISSLPPEMLRAGRFDKVLFVGYPSFDERVDIFKINLSMTEDADARFDWEQLATETLFMTGSEIVSLIAEAQFKNIYNSTLINTSSLIAAKKSTKNILWARNRNFVQNMYRTAYDQHEWASTKQREEAKYIFDGVGPSHNKVSSGIRVKS